MSDVPWDVIAELVLEILKLIMAHRNKGELVAELHDAQECAHDTGECQGLIDMRDRLLA